MNYFLRLAHFLALVFAIFALGCLLNIAVKHDCQSGFDCRLVIFGISVSMLSVLYSANNALAAIYRKEKSPD